jgi:hypothetical protein
MCSNCTYGNYGKCEICDEETCYKQLWSSICYTCFKTMQKKRRCRTCKIIFESGNKLFKHLDMCQECKKDYIPFEHYIETCNTWMEEYCLIGYSI